MLVVATYEELGFGQGEDRPYADLVAHAVAALDFNIDDLGRSWCVEPAEGSNSVSDYQKDLHPQGVVREDAKENVDDAGTRAAQGCAVGISKISSLDQAAIQHAEGGDITFHNGHVSSR